MTLVFDERDKLQGQPGLHALIAGVSNYPHLPKTRKDADTRYSLGMRQLSSTSLTAYRVYCWLKEQQHNLPVPLTTCRLLLSPSLDEKNAEPELNNLAVDSCSLTNFLKAAKDWRTDASTNQNNITLFYFAGHGVQRSKDDAVLLLEGFGDGVGVTLFNAVDINNIFNGMASSSERSQMAQTQLYFVDACRNLPSQFKDFEKLSTTSVFDVELAGRDDRRAPIFYAAAPDSSAQAIPRQQTLFSKALLECLNGAAGQSGKEEDENGQVKWLVSVHSLSEALETIFKDYRQKYKTDQDFTVGGLVKNADIYFLDSPPLVEISIEVEPNDGHPFTSVVIRDNKGRIVWKLKAPLSPHPYEGKLPAGIYSISGKITPPCPPYVDFKPGARQVNPPRLTWKVKVK